MSQHFLTRQISSTSHQESESAGKAQQVQVQNASTLKKMEPESDTEDAPTVPSSPNPSLPSLNNPQSSPWIASHSDYRFARNIINDSGEPIQQLMDEADKLCERYNIASEYVRKKKPKHATPLSLKLLSNLPIPQQIVFTMAELRQQLLKVVEALLQVIRATDTPTPKLMAQMYEYNNVVRCLHFHSDCRLHFWSRLLYRPCNV